MDDYSVLGLAKNASQEDIKKAYRKLAFEYHPDRNPGDVAADKKFKQIQEAYDRLTNSTIKTSVKDDDFPAHGFWESFFGGKVSKEERGRNTQTTIEVELKDVLTGCSREIVVPQKIKCNNCSGKGFSEYKSCGKCSGTGKISIKTTSAARVYMGCSDCGGSGKAPVGSCKECNGKGSKDDSFVTLVVNIPPGIVSGQKIAVHGYGEVVSSGKNGDLIITVVVRDHKYFDRNGANLILEYPVSYSELCLGAKVEIPTLTGSVVLTIPPNTQDGTNFYLKEIGLPYPQGGKGDMIVVVKMALPSKDKIDNYRSLLESLANLDKESLTKARELYKL